MISGDAAGEAIYAAVFDAAPSLQSLFKTARLESQLWSVEGQNSLGSEDQHGRSFEVGYGYAFHEACLQNRKTRFFIQLPFPAQTNPSTHPRNGLTSIVAAAQDPKQLKNQVEYLGNLRGKGLELG